MTFSMPLRPFDPIDIAPDSAPADASAEYMGRAAITWRIGAALVLIIV